MSKLQKAGGDMDLIMEILLELIFEGTLEMVTSKKIPMFIRLLAAVLLLAFYIGFGGVLIYIGIKHKSIVVIICAVVLLLVVWIVTVKKYKEIRG